MPNIKDASQLIAEQIQSALTSNKKRDKEWLDTRSLFDYSNRYTGGNATTVSTSTGSDTYTTNKDDRKPIDSLEPAMATRYENDFKSIYPDGADFEYTKILNSTRQGKLMTGVKDKQAEDNKWRIALDELKSSVARYNKGLLYTIPIVQNNNFSVMLKSIPMQDALIDPRAKSNNIHTGRYIGFRGIIKTKADLIAMMKIERDPVITQNIKRVLDSLADYGRNSPTPYSFPVNQQSIYSDIGKPSVEGEVECYVWFYVDVGTNKRYSALVTVDRNELISHAPLEANYAVPDYMIFPLAHCWGNVSEIDTYGQSPLSMMKPLIKAEKEAILQQITNGRRINNPTEYVKSTAVDDLAQFKNKDIRTKLMSPNFDARVDISSEKVTTIGNSDFITQAIGNIKNNIAPEVSANLSGQNVRRRQSVTDFRNSVEQNRRRTQPKIDAYKSCLTDVAHLFVSDVVMYGTPQMLIKEVGLDGQEISSVINRSELLSAKDINSAMIEIDVSFENKEIDLIEQKEKEGVLGLVADSVPNKNEVIRQMLSEKFPTDTVETLLSSTSSEASAAVRRDVQEIISGNKINPPTGVGFDYITEFSALVDKKRYHLSDKNGDLTKEGKMLVDYFKKVLKKLLEVDTRDLFEDELDRVYKALTQTDNPTGKIDIKALFANQQTTTQSS